MICKNDLLTLPMIDSACHRVKTYALILSAACLDFTPALDLIARAFDPRHYDASWGRPISAQIVFN